MTDDAQPPKRAGRGAWKSPAKSARPPKPRGNPAWKKGVSGNPHGKPIGAKNKISKAFLEDVLTHWQKNGAKALDKLLDTDPVAYAQMLFAIASVQDQPTDGAPPPTANRETERQRVLGELATLFNQPAPVMIESTPIPDGSEHQDG